MKSNSFRVISLASVRMVFLQPVQVDKGSFYGCRKPLAACTLRIWKLMFTYFMVFAKKVDRALNVESSLFRVDTFG